MQTLEDLQEERYVLINYLNAKTKAEDWHACADAAMDLRELDVKIKYEYGQRVTEYLPPKGKAEQIFSRHLFAKGNNFDDSCAICGCSSKDQIHG